MIFQRFALTFGLANQREFELRKRGYRSLEWWGCHL